MKFDSDPTYLDPSRDRRWAREVRLVSTNRATIRANHSDETLHCQWPGPVDVVVLEEDVYVVP